MQGSVKPVNFTMLVSLHGQRAGILFGRQPKGQDSVAVIFFACAEVVGIRSDVQPCIGIALKLQEYGHRVRIATPVWRLCFAPLRPTAA